MDTYGCKETCLSDKESISTIDSAAFISIGMLPFPKLAQGLKEEKEYVKILDSQPNELLYALVTYTVSKEIPHSVFCVNSSPLKNGEPEKGLGSYTFTSFSSSKEVNVKEKAVDTNNFFPQSVDVNKNVDKDSVFSTQVCNSSELDPSFGTSNLKFDDSEKYKDGHTNFSMYPSVTEAVSQFCNLFDIMHTPCTLLSTSLSIDSSFINKKVESESNTTVIDSQKSVAVMGLISMSSKDKIVDCNENTAIMIEDNFQFDSSCVQNSKRDLITQFYPFVGLSESPIISGDFDGCSYAGSDLENVFDPRDVKLSLSKEEELMYDNQVPLCLDSFSTDQMNTPKKQQLDPTTSSVILNEECVDIAVYSMLSNSLFVFTWNSTEKKLKQKFSLECVARGFDKVTAIGWTNYSRNELPYICIGQQSGAFCIYHQNCRGTLYGDFEKEIRSIRYDNEQDLLVLLIAGNSVAVIPLLFVEQTFQAFCENVFPAEFIKACVYTIPKNGLLNDTYLLKEGSAITSAYTFVPQIEEFAGLAKSDSLQSSFYFSEQNSIKRNTAFTLEEVSINPFFEESESPYSKLVSVNTKAIESAVYTPNNLNQERLVYLKKFAGNWHHRLLLLVGENPVLSLITMAEIAASDHGMQEADASTVFDKDCKQMKTLDCMLPLFQRLFNYDSVEFLQSEVEKCGLWEGKRKGIRLIECPWKENIILLLDNLGQISLISADMLVTLHVWKGYREADATWLSYTKTKSPHNVSAPENNPTFSLVSPNSLGGIVIYTRRRSLLELWDVSSFTRLFAFTCTETGDLLQSNGNVFFAGISGRVHKIEWKIPVA